MAWHGLPLKVHTIPPDNKSLLPLQRYSRWHPCISVQSQLKASFLPLSTPPEMHIDTSRPGIQPQSMCHYEQLLIHQNILYRTRFYLNPKKNNVSLISCSRWTQQFNNADPPKIPSKVTMIFSILTPFLDKLFVFSSPLRLSLMQCVVEQVLKILLLMICHCSVYIFSAKWTLLCLYKLQKF